MTNALSRTCTLALTLAILLPQPAAARFSLASLRQRLGDAKVVLRPVKGGSVDTYLNHCQRLGTGTTLNVTEVKTKGGASCSLAAPRRVAEVTTSPWGLRRYLNHVGTNSVELVFNQHSSEYGHMLVRAGRQIYEFGNVRSADAGGFGAKVVGWSGMVGMVYKVDAAKLPEVQKALGELVSATKAFNLPPFDSYGKPVRLTPKGEGTFSVVSPSSGKYRAAGDVQARKVEVGGKQYLEAPNGLRVEVLKQNADGSVMVDTMTCTSFPIKTLQRLLPSLKFDKLNGYAQVYARSAVTNIVRGDTPAVPDLVTVYSRGKGTVDVQQRVFDIGKKSATDRPEGD